MKKPAVFKNNHQIEIIPIKYIESFIPINSKVVITLKNGKEPFNIDAVIDTIKPSSTNQSKDAGDIYQVDISFRISYINSETTIMLQTLKNLGGLIVSYISSGGETIVLGTTDYPMFLNYNTPSDFDGYEVTLSGTQDISPLFRIV